MTKKKKIIVVIITLIALLGAGGYYWFINIESVIDDGRNEGKKISVQTTEGDLGVVGQLLLEKYMYKFIMKDSAVEVGDDIADTIENFEIHGNEFLGANGDEFAVLVSFKVMPFNADSHKSWGDIDEEGKIEGKWILKIKRLEENNYILLDKEKAKSNINKSRILKEIKEGKTDESNVNLTNKICDYKIEDINLQVTFDKGINWIDVPYSAEIVTDRAEQVNDKKTLQEGSYYITEDKIAFAYGGSETSQITTLISNDKGETFKKSIVTNEDIKSRAIYMGFTSQDNGYVVVAGDRAMRFEMTYVFLTNDGGQSWYKIGDTSKITNMLVTGAAFSTDEIGFISFRSADNIYILL